MRKTSSIAAAVTLAVAFAAIPLAAQTAEAVRHRPRWGPQLSYDFNGDNLGGGARLEYSLQGFLRAPHIDAIGEANWFPGSTDLFDFAYNVVYRFQTTRLEPYAGGGLSLGIASGNGSTNADLHLNAVAGLRLAPLGRVTPVVQLRYVFVQGDALLLTGGILF